MTDNHNIISKTILITGATGYIGGRLTPLLIKKGYTVHVLVRDPKRLEGRDWTKNVKIFKGDVFDKESMLKAMKNVDVAFYLIHSMDGSKDFHDRDLLAAKTFSKAAAESNIKQIIYLGGLGDPNQNLSEHLGSRQETGKALSQHGVPVTEFRAAIIVGSGSISFEMIRYLTERIPIMICPKWVKTRVQPIGINDVLSYLTQAIETPQSIGKIIEIGGSDILTYGDMIQEYGKARELKRIMISIPFLTPRLSSYWVHWMTPVPASITRPLVEGLRNEVIVRNNNAKEIFPNISPMDYRTSIDRALDVIEKGILETRWTDALISSANSNNPVILKTQEGLTIERRQITVKAKPSDVFNTFIQLGGDQGWLYMNWAWRFRGAIDRLLGGVGLRRGRRDSNQVRIGDAIDFWRVESVEANKLLRLRAEMKVPGKAWLQFEVLPSQEHSVLTQTAFFAPKGLSGFLYWYLLYPIHSLIFSGMIKRIGRLAESS